MNLIDSLVVFSSLIVNQLALVLKLLIVNFGQFSDAVLSPSRYFISLRKLGLLVSLLIIFRFSAPLLSCIISIRHTCSTKTMYHRQFIGWCSSSLHDNYDNYAQAAVRGKVGSHITQSSLTPHPLPSQKNAFPLCQ